MIFKEGDIVGLKEDTEHDEDGRAGREGVIEELDEGDAFDVMVAFNTFEWVWTNVKNLYLIRRPK